MCIINCKSTCLTLFVKEVNFLTGRWRPLVELPASAAPRQTERVQEGPGYHRTQAVHGRRERTQEVGQTEAGYGALSAPTVVLLVVYVTADIY